MISAPSIIEAAPRPTAVIRLTITRDQIQHVMGPAVQEYMEAVAAKGQAPAGPLFSWHYDMQPDTFDFGVPVASPIQPVGRVYDRTMPAGRALRSIYTGPYEGPGEGWGVFMEWIEASGRPIANGLWECYLTGPESTPDPSTWQTEIYKPLSD